MISSAIWNIFFEFRYFSSYSRRSLSRPTTGLMKKVEIRKGRDIGRVLAYQNAEGTGENWSRNGKVEITGGRDNERRL